MARNKYKLRSDGRREGTKVYNGKVKHFYGRSDAEIEEKIAKYEKSLEQAKITLFKAVANEYWDKKEKDIALNTVSGYELAVNRAIDEFGELPIDSITAHDVYDYLAKFKAQGYSSKVITNTKSVLKGIFDYAFLMGKVDMNPCVGIPVVKGKPKVARQPASDADIKIIEEFKNESSISKMFYFCLYTGARRGEAAALQMKNLDLKNKTARITQTLVYGNQHDATIKDCPKTEAGFRSLELLDNVIEILPTYKNKDTYIFFPNGFPSRKLYNKMVDEFRTKHGIKSTLHQLRHSYASLLHSANVDVKDAQSLLGHSSIVVTQDIYTHLDREKHTEVRENLNEFVKNRTSSKTSS